MLMAKKILLTGSIVIVFTATVIFCYRNLGNWLLVSDPEPEKIDLVFTFAGGPLRDERSIELLKKHPEAKWLSSTGNHCAIITLCKKSKIDTSRVTIIDTCTSTWGEVEVLKCYLKKNRLIKIVGLVSNEWHMRRIKMSIFKQGIKRVQIASLPVPLEISGPQRQAFKRWWKKEAPKAIVESEITKLGYYMLGMSNYPNMKLSNIKN
jgi:hypothetical protein